MSATADFQFGKAQRLLNTHDFKSVFDDAVLKVSSKELLILARPTASTTARLGLVVAKRHVRLVTRRNRVKRIVRESFRYARPQLAGIDGIVLARGGADLLDNSTLRQQLDQLWRQLERKAARARRADAPC